MPELTYSHSNFECPYCNTEYGDSWELSKETDHELECPKCGKSYIGIAEVSLSYSARPIEEE